MNHERFRSEILLLSTVNSFKALGYAYPLLMLFHLFALTCHFVFPASFPANVRKLRHKEAVVIFSTFIMFLITSIHQSS